jgi:hypothetical protein
MYYGTEFHGYPALEAATEATFYFATPHPAWEQGTNDNTNGLVRQYTPKRCTSKLTLNATTLRRWLWSRQPRAARPRSSELSSLDIDVSAREFAEVGGANTLPHIAPRRQVWWVAERVNRVLVDAVERLIRSEATS